MLIFLVLFASRGAIFGIPSISIHPCAPALPSGSRPSAFSFGLRVDLLYIMYNYVYNIMPNLALYPAYLFVIKNLAL